MLKKIAAAADTVVSVDRAKTRLFIESSEFDDDLESLLRAAEAALEHQTGLVISVSSWEYRAGGWSGCWRNQEWCRWSLDRGFYPSFSTLVIPSGPVRAVTAITYLDADNVEQTIAPGSYSWERTPEGAVITLADGFVAPILSNRPQSVRIVFDAGYDTSTPDGGHPDLLLPPQAEMAILFLVGHWHANREPVVIGNPAANLPLTFEMLAQQLRVYR